MSRLLVLLALVLAWQTHQSAAVWASEYTLWRSNLAVSPTNTTFLVNMGDACLERHEFACAVAMFDHASRARAETDELRRVRAMASENLRVTQLMRMAMNR